MASKENKHQQHNRKRLFEAVLYALRDGMTETEIQSVVHYATLEHEETAHQEWVNEGGNGNER